MSSVHAALPLHSPQLNNSSLLLVCVCMLCLCVCLCVHAYACVCVYSNLKQLLLESSAVRLFETGTEKPVGAEKGAIVIFSPAVPPVY